MRNGKSHWTFREQATRDAGREGTGNLVEIVLAQCGVSAQDKATPLLQSAMALKATNVDSAEEIAAIAATRRLAAAALTANQVDYEFGAGEAPEEAESPRSVAKGLKYPALKKFTGQETTRQSFLQLYASVKAKGHVGDAEVDDDDPNAAPVQKKVTVGKKTKFRPHEQVEAAVPHA